MEAVPRSGRGVIPSASVSTQAMRTVKSSLGPVMLVTAWCTAAPAALLDLAVHDEAGQALPCRVLVRPQGGPCVVPEGAVELKIGPDRWFMSSGRSQVEVPEGPVLLRVERGPEYVRIKEDVQVTGPQTSQTVTLRRWIDMQRRGYLCGENHLHVDSVTLAPMLVAEGLDFGSSLTWWNGPDQRRPIPAGAGRVRTLTYAGRQIPASVYDAELEYAWGAAYIQSLPAPLPLPAEPGRPNLDYLRHAAESGALVHYQGGWSREVALDALLGYVHTINICNNNFALHRFQPRSRYSNLLDVEGFPVYPDTERGMLRMNTDTYYRLLNWGLHLAAGAGSATGVKQAPVGYNRAYVQLQRGATLDEFNAAWKAGRNFVTNGPMLFLKTRTGQHPGDTVALPPDGGTVWLEVEAAADQPLSAVEVIVNGELAASLAVDDPRQVNAEVEIEITQGAWIAARCTARDELLSDEELAAYRQGDDREPYRIRPSRLRFAHTSPIYVTVAGRGAAVRESIAEGLRMLDRFAAFARDTADPKYQASIQAAVDQARATLEARFP